MNWPHPFFWLPASALVLAFVIALVATMVMYRVLEAFSPPNLPGAPPGILALEFAGTTATVSARIAAWTTIDPNAIARATTQTRLDHLFIVAYVSACALGCALAARSLEPDLPVAARIGVALAWVAVLAGVLDVIENAGLFEMLNRNFAQSVVARTYWCAVFKFAGLIAGVAYSLVSLVRAIVRALI
jgi:hypothetical protein